MSACQGDVKAPIAAATTAKAQELGVRVEGGIFILFFLFAWREASGYF